MQVGLIKCGLSWSFSYVPVSMSISYYTLKFRGPTLAQETAVVNKSRTLCSSHNNV